MPTPLVAPFRDLTIEQGKGLVNAALASLSLRINAFAQNAMLGMIELPLVEPFRISRAFIDGDHWQNSSAWIGPRPDITASDNEAYTLTMQEIARQFISQNAIGEVTDRHVNGVIGVMPDFGFTSRVPVEEGEEVSSEIQTLADEVIERITVWWDRNGVLETLHDFAVSLLISERAMLRLLVPRGKLSRRPVLNEQDEEIGTLTEVRATTLEDALRLIFVEHPLPDKSVMACDDDTREEVGIVLFARKNLLQPNVAIGGEDRAEFTYLVGQDDQPKTVIRMVEGQASKTLTLDLGGRLTMYEGTRPLFVTPQMWQQQKGLNLALSMIPRTVVTAGFLERTILNAQMPGHWQDEAKTIWVPHPYYTGPGATNSLVGIATTNPVTGEKTLTTPSIEYREPIDTEPLLKAANAHYVAILQEAKQQHILAIQNTQASGKTHEQARADFKTSLGRTRTVMETAGIWMLETLLAMCEQFTGAGPKYTSKLRATFQCHLDVGPVTSEVRTALDGSVRAGTLSRETAIAEAGTVDTGAEMERLDTQRGAHLDIIERQATVLVQLTQAGASLGGAAEFVGIDEETALALTEFGPNELQPPDKVPTDPEEDPEDDLEPDD